MVERFFRWTCNRCGKTVEKGEYGLPTGWTWVRRGLMGPIEHLCGCQKENEGR